MLPTQPGNNSRNDRSRNLHIAHRRSPSELTPLMVEQLALQQQIEMLQAQQQQIIAQQQQFAQAGLLPPGLPPGMNQGLMPPPPPPGYLPAPQYQYQPGPLSSPQQQQQLQQQQQQQLQQQQQQQGQHRRGHSSAGSQGNISNNPERTNSGGHARRHSLALNEAKKAAAIAQAKRLLHSGDSSPTQAPAAGESSPTKSASTSSPPGSSPSFKFPSSPETSESAVYRPPSNRFGGGGGSGSRSGNSRPGSGTYQFPPPEGEPSNSHERKPSQNHQRMGSRNFDQNWRQSAQTNMSPPPLPGQGDFLQPPLPNQFVPGHRSRGSYNNNSVSSISGYQGYGGQGNQQRKSLFVPYLPQASLPGLLGEGRLVAGILRVNRKNRSDAYVSTEGLLDADIFICGSKDRNRALEGDLVAVELLEVDEVWGSKREKEEKKKRRDHHTSMSTSSISVEDNKSDATTSGHGGAELGRRGSLKQRPTQKKNDDVEVEGQSLLLVEEEELNDQIKPLYAGHVVAVIERIPGQIFSGSLGLLRPSAQATKDKQTREKGDHDSRPADRPKIVWFKPTDKRVPLIAIPTEQAPKDFVENHERYADKLFVASIKRWPITSLHPFGTLVEELGPANALNIEIEGILRDNNFVTGQFPDAVQKALPGGSDDSDIVNAANEFGPNRSDFTKHSAIAFLSAGGRNFSDQAITVKQLSKETTELVVHTLDVTHFVSENSAADREAKKRATSVFLKQREIYMLPAELNSYISFKENKASPTISIIFQINSKGEITDSKMEPGIVKPTELATLNVVESVLNGTAKDATDSLARDIKALHKLSLDLRRQRLQVTENEQNSHFLGLLDLIEDEKVQVNNINIFDSSPAEQLLSEINYTVNAAVAQKIHAVLGDRALLRRQADPILSRLESFAETLRLLNIPFDSISSAGLQRALAGIPDSSQRKGLEVLFYKCLTRAKYFLPGKLESSTYYGHYLLNLPLFTHFTAPLRRYADLIVHRQLKHVLSGTDYNEDLSALSSSVDYCNFKKDSARNAQEQSIHLFLSQVIGKLSSASGGQIISDGIVIQVYESAFDVLIPEFGIEKRVHGDQLPLTKAEFHKKNRILELFWEVGADSSTFIPEDEKGVNNGRASTLDTAIAQSLSKLTLDDATNEVASLTARAGSKVNILESTNLKLPASLDSHGKALESFLQNVNTKVEGPDHIQEIQLLQHVPVIIRAELGKGIPCITIRTVNPFKSEA